MMCRNWYKYYKRFILSTGNFEWEVSEKDVQVEATLASASVDEILDTVNSYPLFDKEPVTYWDQFLDLLVVGFRNNPFLTGVICLIAFSKIGRAHV
jgi:hypothetical protein